MSRRPRLCSRTEWEISAQIPADTPPWPECADCLLLRRKGAGAYSCHVATPRYGTFVHKPKTRVRRVVLREDIVVEGVTLARGTRLAVTGEGTSSEGYWCKFPRKRGGAGGQQAGVLSIFVPLAQLDVEEQ